MTERLQETLDNYARQQVQSLCIYKIQYSLVLITRFLFWYTYLGKIDCCFNNKHAIVDQYIYFPTKAQAAQSRLERKRNRMDELRGYTSVRNC